MKRRALLSSAIGASILVSGWLTSGGPQDGEGTTVEIIPNNNTDQQVSLDVAVYETDGSLLLNHTHCQQVKLTSHEVPKIVLPASLSKSMVGPGCATRTTPT